MADDFEIIGNLHLIQNGIEHLVFEAGRGEPSYFRIARESHAVLYRSMIEVLRGSDNSAITGDFRKDWKPKYKIGERPWMMIEKVKIDGCRKAWRYSSPEPCEEPVWPDPKDLPEEKTRDYLIKFYPALAMIQTECFMCQLVFSRPVLVSDAHMKVLEWLHEDIRNEYEHFVPKTYAAPRQSLLEATVVCFSLARDLILNSGNTLFFPISREAFVTLFGRGLTSLRALRPETASPSENIP